MIGNIVLVHQRNISSNVTSCLQTMYTTTSSHQNSHLSGNQQNFFKYCYDGNQDLQRKENIMKIRQILISLKENLNIFMCLFYKRKKEK